MRGRFFKNIAIAGALASALYVAVLQTPAQKNPQISQNPQLDAQHERHILYGDAHGGGHLYGTGHACKSEFPANWRAEDIVTHVTADAANDSLNWQPSYNGYDVAEVTDNGVKIRIVVDRRRNLIITAYPLNTQRNPCPRGAANDN